MRFSLKKLERKSGPLADLADYLELVIEAMTYLEDLTYRLARRAS
jgi:hypothetical protein